MQVANYGKAQPTFYPNVVVTLHMFNQLYIYVVLPQFLSVVLRFFTFHCCAPRSPRGHPGRGSPRQVPNLWHVNVLTHKLNMIFLYIEYEYE